MESSKTQLPVFTVFTAALAVLIAALVAATVIGCNAAESSTPAKPAGLQASDIEGHWVYFGSDVVFDRAHPETAVEAGNGFFALYKFNPGGTWEGVAVLAGEQFTLRTGTWEIADNKLHVSAPGGQVDGATLKEIDTEAIVNGDTMSLTINDPITITHVSTLEFDYLVDYSASLSK